MSFTVEIAYAAALDIRDIKLIVERVTGPGSANRRIEGIAHIINQLATLPFGGAVIPELDGLGISAIRRKPAPGDHVVYKLDEANKKITVLLVYSQKKDFQSILTKRILRP